MTLSRAGRSRGINGATSAGSFTKRHILSMTRAAFLFSAEERPLKALPSSGAISAKVGESTVIIDYGLEMSILITCYLQNE